MNKNNFKIIIKTSSFLIFLSILSCTANNKTAYSELDSYFSYYAEKRALSGSVLIAEKGNIIIKKGYGMIDYGNNTPFETHTKVRIASVTKQFTAMSIMILQNQDKLNITDKISKYLTDFPEGDKISIYNLLTHTSGVYSSRGKGDIDKYYKYHNQKEIYDILKGKPLNFEPDTKVSYSNGGYFLLGLVIEKVSGQGYGDFLQKNIFTPLDMTNTIFDESEDSIDNSLYGYTRSYLDLTPVVHEIHSSVSYSAGGIISNVEDLFKWDRALNENILISKDETEEMMSLHEDMYGYGFMFNEIFLAGKNRKIVWHFGNLLGFHSIIMKFIDDDITIIMLCNIAGDYLMNTGVEAAGIVYTYVN